MALKTNYKAGDMFEPADINSTNSAVNKLAKTIRANIAVNVTPTALSSYNVWDTQKLYGYSATITVSGLTTNSMIENLIMTDTLLSSVAYIATTGTNSLTFYTQDNTALEGTIITLVTSEVG